MPYLSLLFCYSSVWFQYISIQSIVCAAGSFAVNRISGLLPSKRVSCLSHHPMLTEDGCALPMHCPPCGVFWWLDEVFFEGVGNFTHDDPLY
ncbi:hypothetical protein RP20_CCG025298 [Aedes albopictus]|nr:hypothetical protein RP20_CCG025298 [Aedes albopictus]